MVPASGSTQVRLVKTARRLFHEQGYHATGLATILREVPAIWVRVSKRVSSGTFHGLDPTAHGG
jgi:AcrR family transcriptional regulator